MFAVTMSNSVSPMLEVFKLFCKLGFIAFGGPAAHIAMMRDEVVEKRQWMSEQYFLDLMGATNLIPGPNSTEMALHCGYHRAGLLGLVVAGISFILPAITLTGFLGFLYLQYGELDYIKPFLFGIKPAVIAIILAAVYKLGKKAVKKVSHAIIGLLLLVAVAYGLNEIAAIFLAGAVATLWFLIEKNVFRMHFALPLPLLVNLPEIVISNQSLFLVFLKIGAVLFGSGYVLVAYLDLELVQNLSLLNRAQLLDAIALGQFTPGPVLSTATFVGYLIADIEGAILATIGIFLPSFLFVLILNPLVPKMRNSKITSWFLDGVNIGAVIIMLWVTLKLGYSLSTDWRAMAIMVIAIAASLLIKKINSVYLVIGGMVLGWLLLLV